MRILRNLSERLFLWNTVNGWILQILCPKNDYFHYSIVRIAVQVKFLVGKKGQV